MKIKITSSNFNKETGISKVTINTPLGEFTGIAKLHEEDKNIMSEFAGCQYAEMRAILKYIKKKIQILNWKIESLENYQKVWKSKATYEHQNDASRTLRKQIYLLKQDRYNWQQKYSSLSEKLQQSIIHRETIINKIKERKESK